MASTQQQDLGDHPPRSPEVPEPATRPGPDEGSQQQTSGRTGHGLESVVKHLRAWEQRRASDGTHSVANKPR